MRVKKSPLPGRWLVVLLITLAGTGRVHAQSPVVGALNELVKTRAPGWQSPPGLNVMSGSLLDKPRHVPIPLPLDGGRCYRVLLVASQSIGRIGVTWLGPEQQVQASAPPTGTEVVLESCPPQRGLHSLDLVPRGGDGSYAFRIVAAPPAPAPIRGDGGALPDGGVAAAPTPPPEPPDPNAADLEKFTGAAAPGAPLIVKHRGVVADGGAPYDFRVELPGDKCFVFAAAGSVGIQELSIYVWDPDDNRLTQTREVRWPVAHFCSGRPGKYHFLVKATKGGGGFSAAVVGPIAKKEK